MNQLIDLRYNISLTPARPRALGLRGAVALAFAMGMASTPMACSAPAEGLQDSFLEQRSQAISLMDWGSSPLMPAPTRLASPAGPRRGPAGLFAPPDPAAPVKPRWYGFRESRECPKARSAVGGFWRVERPFALLHGTVADFLGQDRELLDLCVYTWAPPSKQLPSAPPSVSIQLEPDPQSFIPWSGPLPWSNLSLDMNIAEDLQEHYVHQLQPPNWSELESDRALAAGVWVAHVDTERLAVAKPAGSLPTALEHRTYTEAISEAAACDAGHCAFQPEYYDALFRSDENHMTGGLLSVALAAARAHTEARRNGKQAVIGLHLALYGASCEGQPTFPIFDQVLEQLACAGDLLIAAGGNRLEATAQPHALPGDWHTRRLVCDGRPLPRARVLRVNAVNGQGGWAHTALRTTGLRAPGGATAFVRDSRAIWAMGGSSLASAVVTATAGAMSAVRPDLSPVELGEVLGGSFGDRRHPAVTICGALRAVCNGSSAGLCPYLSELCGASKPTLSSTHPGPHPAGSLARGGGHDCAAVPARGGDGGFPKKERLFIKHGDRLDNILPGAGVTPTEVQFWGNSGEYFHAALNASDSGLGSHPFYLDLQTLGSGGFDWQNVVQGEVIFEDGAASGIVLMP